MRRNNHLIVVSYKTTCNSLFVHFGTDKLIMMMMILVSEQHIVTTKYTMQATPYFSILCQSGEEIIMQKCRKVGFAAGQVDFQITCPAGRVAVQTIFEA